MYGEDRLQAALTATEWVLDLPYPPEGHPQAELAASGLPDCGWPETPGGLQGSKMQTARRRYEYLSRPAIPEGPPQATALAGSQSSGVPPPPPPVRRSIIPPPPSIPPPPTRPVPK